MIAGDRGWENDATFADILAMTMHDETILSVYTPGLSISIVLEIQPVISVDD